MRRSALLSLIMLGLATPILWGQGHPAPQPARQRGKPNKIFKINGRTPKDLPEHSFVVSSGLYANRDDALEDALEEGRKKIVSQVGTDLKKPHLGWSSDTAFVRRYLLADLHKQDVEPKDFKGELEGFLINERYQAVEETRQVDLPELHDAKRVFLKVVLNSENWKQIQKEIQEAEDHDRVSVMHDRMIFLVKLLISIVALLGTVCGYLRLDEWSKGYYTKWLRLAAVGCIGAVTVFLWMLVRQ